MAKEMTKAQKLELAAAEAPLLRNASPKTLARRVAIVDKDGNVVGYTSGREVLKGLAAVQELEHAVEDGKRPKEVICKKCGKLVKVKRAGGVPTICVACSRGTCSVCGALTSAHKKPKARRPTMCGPCARRAMTNPPTVCPDCGVLRKRAQGVRCAKCARAHRVAQRPDATCGTCGVKLARNALCPSGRRTTCRSCHMQKMRDARSSEGVLKGRDALKREQARIAASTAKQHAERRAKAWATRRQRAAEAAKESSSR